MIPAWNPTTRNLYVYKTAHHPRFSTDYKDRAVDVAMATAAAPTYFREHITDDDVGLIDGGVWANNPMGAAVVEAVAVLGWPADRLQVLSLGSLEETYASKSGWYRHAWRVCDQVADGRAIEGLHRDRVPAHRPPAHAAGRPSHQPRRP